MPESDVRIDVRFQASCFPPVRDRFVILSPLLNQVGYHAVHGSGRMRGESSLVIGERVLLSALTQEDSPQAKVDPHIIHMLHT